MSELLICCDCHAAFPADEAATRYEFHGEFSEPVSACPHCGSFDLDEAERCAGCWEAHSVQSVAETLFGSHPGGMMCKECLIAALTPDAFAAFGTANTPHDEMSLFEQFVVHVLLMVPDDGRSIGSSAPLRRLLTAEFYKWAVQHQDGMPFTGNLWVGHGEILKDEAIGWMDDNEAWGDFADWRYENEGR